MLVSNEYPDLTRKDLRALAESRCQPFLSVTLALLSTLDGHVERTKMVLKLEVDGALGSRQIHLHDLLAPGNLIDLRNVLSTQLNLRNVK